MMSAAVLGGSRFHAAKLRTHSQFGPEIGGLFGVELYLICVANSYTASFTSRWRFQGAR
jgi:hypothetical protein